MENISGKLLASGARLSVAALLFSFASVAHAGIAAREYRDLSKWDVRDYVQEGLVLHYDGVRNVGADAEHSEATDTWVNLASDGEYPLGWYSWIKRDGEDKYDRKNGDTSNGAWAANGFAFDGLEGFAATNISFSIGPTYTLQFVMKTSTADLKNENGTTGYIFRPGKGWEYNAVAIRQSANGSTTPANAVYIVDRTRFGANTPRANFVDANPHYATVISDTAAIRIFEGTEIPTSETGDNSYKTKSKTAADDNTWFAIGSQYDNSPRSPRNNLQSFNGTLHAIRYYSKALSEDELERNRIVDDARFFGKRHPIAVTNVVIASTYSFLDGTEPAGFYQIDDSHTFTAEKEVMTTNSFKYACTGYSLETWNYATESWGDPVMSNGVLFVTISASDRKRVTWLWKATRAAHTADDYTLADYSLAGLVLNYDGIYNDGADNPHSKTTQKWKNLAQGWEDQDMYAVNYSLDNNTGDYNSINVQKNKLEMNGEWNEKDNGYVFDGEECFMKWNEGRKFILPPAYTWQFAMDAKTADQRDSNGGISYLFLPHDGNSNGSWMNGSVQMRVEASGAIPADSIVLTDEPRYGTTNIRPCFSDPSPRFATIRADSTVASVFGGVEIPTSGLGCKEGALAVTRTNNWFVIGGQYNPSSGRTLAHFQGFHGTMHSVRFYDRPLTEEELKRNREADSARFFGELATTNVVEVIGDKETAYKVEGEWTFTPPDTATDVAGYRLFVLRDNGDCEKLEPFQLGRKFDYSETNFVGKTIKLEWAPQPPGMMIIVR